jgi:hypothetical protein
MDTKDPPSCDQTCLRFKKSRWPSSELPHRVSRLQRILISCSSKVVDGSQRIQNMDTRLTALNSFELFTNRSYSRRTYDIKRTALEARDSDLPDILSDPAAQTAPD